MNAKELMIGDWVQIDAPDRYAGAIGEVKSLRFHQEKDSAYFHIFISGRHGIVSHEVCSDDIRPVPLTPEILEKNGFRVVFDGDLHATYFQEIDGFLTDIKVDKTGIYQKLSMCDGFGNRVVLVECKFVHQLQHAFRIYGINKNLTYSHG